MRYMRERGGELDGDEIYERDEIDRSETQIDQREIHG